MYRVVIDAGHGGKDSGAVGNELYEKNVTLKIVLLIEKLLKNYQNCTVYLTRSTDVWITLAQRSTFSNNLPADLFVSVHINAAVNDKAEGMSTYAYVNASAKSRAFQNVLHKEIATQATFFKDLGQQRADFHVVRETKAPAILTENGFISNKDDSSKLKTDKALAAIALGHVNGIAKFLGLKLKEDADLEDFKGHWAEAAIRDLMAKGIMNGYSDGSFKPDQPVTRAELATVIERIVNQGGTK